jgi:hypothetical protein
MLNCKEKIRREEELKKLALGECIASVRESFKGFCGECPVNVCVKDYLYGEWYSIIVEDEHEYIMAIKMLCNKMYHYQKYEMEVSVEQGARLCAYNVENVFAEDDSDWKYKTRTCKGVY